MHYLPSCTATCTHAHMPMHTLMRSSNHLTGLLPQRPWPRMETLLLGVNKFEGTLPAAWGDMTALKRLQLE